MQTLLIIAIAALLVMLVTTIYAAGVISGNISRTEDDNDPIP